MILGWKVLREERYLIIERNNMQVPILPEGIKFETINIPDNDADFINQLKVSDFIDFIEWRLFALNSLTNSISINNTLLKGNN
jgi:hypothetical protein